MRKVLLAVAGATSILAVGLLATPSNAMTLAAPLGVRAAVTESSGVEQVRLICSHFWNGRWHPRQNCFWAGGPRYRHWYDYGRYHGWRHFHHRRHWY